MDTLRELFRYHRWSTLALLDHCAALPREALNESAPGTHGSILATFVHLVAAEQRYLRALVGEEPQTPIQEGMEPTLADLRAQFERQADTWESLLDRGPAWTVTIPAQRGRPETPNAETLFFLQTLHHGNDHRTQIGTVLGANGRPVADIDGWAYWEAVHRGA